MRCPVCNHKDTKVVDSRMAADGASVRRRRSCDKCEYRFSTSEEVELLDFAVVKRDGRQEAYSRDKLIRGIKKSLEKRPHTDARFDQLVRRIERDIQKKRRRQLTSLELGEIAMRRLRAFDKVAYIRFASVYHSFEDVGTFEEELGKLVKGARGRAKKTKRR